MTDWTKLPALDSGGHIGCLNCGGRPKYTSVTVPTNGISSSETRASHDGRFTHTQAFALIPPTVVPPTPTSHE